MPSPDIITKDWYRDNYLVSTKRSLLQPDAINAAFESDLMWWVERLPDETLQQLLNNSLCIGLYLLPDSTASIAGKTSPQMVGFGRMITDYVSFGYMTDVYILKEHQGKGLCKWMMRCFSEVLDEWPNLRHFFLITDSVATSKLYRNTLGCVGWNETATSNLILMERPGPAVKEEPEEVQARLHGHSGEGASGIEGETVANRA